MVADRIKNSFSIQYKKWEADSNLNNIFGMTSNIKYRISPHGNEKSALQMREK